MHNSEALRDLLDSMTESLAHVPAGPWESVGDGYVVFFVKDCTCPDPQQGDPFKHEPYCRTEVLAKTDPATAALMEKIPEGLPQLIHALRILEQSAYEEPTLTVADLLDRINHVFSQEGVEQYVRRDIT